MRRSPSFAAVLGLLCLVAAAPAAAKEPYESLLKERADMVVSVKYVLHISVSAHGQAQDQEQAGGVMGVMVDPAGLVMIPSGAINPTPRNVRGMDVKITPSDFRVVFAGDPKEYPAILGASDSKLGLAFVRIKDLEGRAVSSLRGDTTAEPTIGDVLYGVSRLPEGFDLAPYVDEVRVTGRVSKPRDLWNIDGSFLTLAHPLFDAKGSVVGVIVPQQGVGEQGGGIFLLPWKVASGTIGRATKAAEEALAEAKAKEAEGAAEKPADKPAEGAPGEKPAEQPGEEKPSGETPPPEPK